MLKKAEKISLKDLIRIYFVKGKGSDTFLL